MNSAVRVTDLRKDYVLSGETIHALRGVSFDVPEGDYISIMGPSGSGKSTLLNLLGCLDRPTSGQFMLSDVDVSRMSDDRLAEIRATRIGFIFQSYNLLSALSVVENIEVPLYYSNRINSAARRRCRELAELVGLGDRLGHRPTQLSGGQQQRVAIARSLVNDPEFILADEPTGNLDSVTTSEILDLLEKLNGEGRTIIMVTHEPDVAARTKRSIVLKDGNIVSDERHQMGVAHPDIYKLVQVMFNVWLRTLQLSVKSLWMHPLRSSLTVLGIFIGVSSVIWLLAIGQGIGRAAQEQISSLGALNILVRTIKPSGDVVQDAGYGLTRADYQRLVATVPSISKAIPIRILPAIEFRNRTRLIEGRLVGTMPDYAEVTRLVVDRGRFLSDADVDKEGNYCVLAAEVATVLFPFEEPVGEEILINDDFYTVVGVMKPRAPSAGIGGSLAAESFSNDVYVPITTLWRREGDMIVSIKPGAFTRDINEVTQITIQVADRDHVLPTADVIRNTIEYAHTMPDFGVTVPLELLEQARTTQLMFILFLGLIATISLVVGGIGIMNIMLATVIERTREVGIRRALGAKRRDITRQFLTESVVLSVLGGTLGILGGIFCRPITLFVRHELFRWFPEQMATVPKLIQEMEPQLIGWSVPLAFAISVLVGVVFGVYPAARAASLDPIEALRHE